MRPSLVSSLSGAALLLLACTAEAPHPGHPPSPLGTFQQALRPDQAGYADQFRFGAGDVVETFGTAHFLVHFPAMSWIEYRPAIS